MLLLSQHCVLDICFSIYKWLNNEECLLVVRDLIKSSATVPYQNQRHTILLCIELRLKPKDSKNINRSPHWQLMYVCLLYHFPSFPKFVTQSLWTLLRFARLKIEPRHVKTNKVNVCPAKTQISLGIRPVWSESSLSAWAKLGPLATHWAHSEDSDQTGRMPRLIWVFAGRTVTLLVLSCRGSNVSGAPGIAFIKISSEKKRGEYEHSQCCKLFLLSWPLK